MAVASVTLAGIQIEGNLIAPDLTSELLADNFKGQAIEDFGFSKADKLADEIAVAWGDAKAYWAAFQRALGRLPEDDPATTVTREQWAVPLLRSLGYDPIYTAKAEVVDGQTYAISHRTNPGEDKPPIHILGCRVGLEQRPPSGTPRLSAHALMQEYLNRTEHLWGVVTNGLQWRLLRDSSLMTRLTYVEFDLEQILSGENFAEFGLFYRLFHRSRLPQGMEDADECLLEFYHQETLQQGGRVRDRLRDGVEQALNYLGNGFLQYQYPGNDQLRQKLQSGELTLTSYYSQLLMLVYRLLFLMVAESREILLSESEPEKSSIYREYYSIERLRMLAERPTWRREQFQDLWQGLKVTFCLFDENWRGQVLGLSPLNGDLFGSDKLMSLDQCGIDNHDLLLAIRYLSLYKLDRDDQLRRINYAALDIEELGSVYESLLDFHPHLTQNQGIFKFQLVAGSERKSTGSYYTPKELSNYLIKLALEPIIDDRLKNLKTSEEKIEALKKLKIIDPACGSGSLLLAAARRIGLEIARVRTGEPQPSSKALRLAIREAIQNCIYGVDINPLVVKLCQVTLWIEGFCQGYPLNVLSHRIKHGNSLVGVFDLDCLTHGIPDAAFQPVVGDQKGWAATLKKRNKREREQINQLTLTEDIKAEDLPQLAEKRRSMQAMPENTVHDVKLKEKRRDEIHRDPQWWQNVFACNLWTAAFFLPLLEQNLQLMPTTEALARYARDRRNNQQGLYSIKPIIEKANQIAEEKKFFHWALEFPEIFEQRGFDCVLGNPPWERIKLQEKEFFAARSLEIANAANKAEREKLIKELPEKHPELSTAWNDAKHFAEAQSKFVRESGRFPLTAIGDVNTYALFAELARKLLATDGRTGIIVPTGIATDDTCKKFFGDLAQKHNLVNLYDFENRKKLFAAVDSRMKFSLLGMSGQPVAQASFAFFLTQAKQADDQSRQFQLSAQDIALLNPNTLTCPVFRTRVDAELTRKIYQHIPVLEDDFRQTKSWNTFYMRLVDSSDHAEFLKFPWQERDTNWNVPLYEAKLISSYDHRFATFAKLDKSRLFDGKAQELSDIDKSDSTTTVSPRYFVPRDFIEALFDKYLDYKRDWLLVYRDVARSTDERTCIAAIIPKVAASRKLPALGFSSKVNPSLLIGNLNSLIFDYIARQKIGGISLSYFILKQLPVIPPDRYTQTDIEFISSRVLELVYTAYDLKSFAQDMGYDGEPFLWNPDRRALLRAELDAYYAKLYGLSRDELRYILDPADVYGSDFPSETFRVLKNNEIKQLGEYRTQRLVLEAWDRMFECR